MWHKTAVLRNERTDNAGPMDYKVGWDYQVQAIIIKKMKGIFQERMLFCKNWLGQILTAGPGH